MKKFIQEFKEFALKGNMMDLAIGMIIGSAFTGIVNSLVNDIINPILGIFTGKIDFSNLFLTLDGSHYETLAAAEKAGAAVFKYGSFISNVINFIIMALVVFCIVKFLNKLRRPEPEKPQLIYCRCSICLPADPRKKIWYGLSLSPLPGSWPNRSICSSRDFPIFCPFPLLS